MEIVTRPHRTHFVEWARHRPEVVVLSADLTGSCEVDLFRDTYPERFFSLGMAEQNMLGFAAGLAREGLRPFLHTFAVFLYRRPYDQLAMSVAYSNLPVRLMGFLPGITTPGGVTHQAIEDIGVLRLMPNMTILECGDATEVESVLDVANAVDGPVYVRMLRGEVPRLFPRSEPMQLGQMRTLSDGHDLALFSAGICTEEALRAVQVLQARGLSIRHLHVSTHKPWPTGAVRAAIAGVKHGVITLENHLINGGIGTAVAETIAESGKACKLVRLGLRDTYAHGASKPYLMREHGLDAMALVAAIEKLVGKKFKIGEDELAAARLDAVHSMAKVEAL